MFRILMLLVVLAVAGIAFPVPRAASQPASQPVYQPPVSQPVQQAAPLKLATSIRPIADMVRNVGGERVEVLALVPPGGEPEDYDPTPADAVAVGKSRVFFANGLGLETYLTGMVEAVGGSQLEVVTLSDGLPVIAGFGQGAEAGGNPHLWLDPQNAIRYVEVIRQTLDRIDPAGAATYDANAAAYTAKLQQLDASIEQQVGTVPAEHRVLVTTHDAYPYFAQRYGFQYLAVVSANPDSDPSAQEYAQLVKTVKDNQVRAVFGEAGFSEQMIAQLAADTGAAFVGDLFTDTLSEAPPTNTYIGAMEYNADTIVSALR
jgi:manganese/iron transport system substrate-binding protein